MRSNTFNYSLLAVGVAALMGVAGTANAAQPTTSTDDKTVVIDNFASATYTVANTSGAPQTSRSNTVTVNVTEQGNFTLLATSPEPVNDNNADTNKDLTINPQAGQTVEFNHTLQNNGNVTDTYTIDLNQLDTDNFNYSGFTINYVTNLNTTSQSINSGGTITLAKDEIATITIVATSDTQRIVGDNGALTVTASSAYLKARNSAAATATYQAVNTDNAITTTPIFAITKSANSNLNNNVFDAANTGAYVDYTIVIKNEGNAVANAFTIVDRLPLGLVIDTTVAPKIGSIALTAGQFTTSSDGRTLTIPNQNLAIGADLTVTLRAIKDANQTIATDATLLNVAEVQDDTLNDTGITNADLIDRSDDKVADENNYEGNSGLGVDNDDDATVTARNQTRDITVTGDAEKEIPLVSTNNVYTYTITNSGTDITEANAADEVYFTVTPTTDIGEINIVRVFIDANNNGKFDSGDTELTADAGNYDLFDIVGATGLTAGETAKVSVELSSNGASSNATGGTNNINDKEVITITVTAQTTVDGTAVPAAGTAASTTTLKGIDLIKGQAVASCTSPGVLNYDTSATALPAQPGQCIYYQITAENTFTEANKTINTVAISDTFDITEVTHNTASFASTTNANSAVANAVYNSPTLTATFDSLAPGEKGTITFSNTILITGATTP